MFKGNILIIDDEEKLRQLLARIISLEGYQVYEASRASSALKTIAQEEIQLVICDVKLPDANGIELVSKIKALNSLIEVVMLTAYGTIHDGVNAIKAGAFDYLTKGDDNDKILPIIERAIEKVRMKKRLERLEEQIEEKMSFKSIIGKSKQITESIDLARKVAETDATVLLLGETGTGKEVFAQAIHQGSTRKLRPFVAINCSAFGKDILESEMFGHKAGAFTGAAKEKKGLFEEANGGTIFLDEIGEMSIDLQSKLLRVLESGSFIKVGDTRQTQVNVRVIAATNRDLQNECEIGLFRLDLYYRLSGFTIKLPALRERPVDIPDLAAYYIQFFAVKVNKRIHGMSDDFKEVLMQHTWKGNTRELKNIIERAVILSDNDILDTNLLPYELKHRSSDYGGQPNSMALADIEKLHISRVLSYTRGNKTEAARLLGIGLTTLYRKMAEYAIN
jgi:two-component system, NtrC family, response regulator